MRLPKKKLTSSEQIREIRYFLNFTNEVRWRSKIRKLETVSRKEPNLRFWLEQRNPLLLPLKRYFEHNDQGRRLSGVLDESLEHLATNLYILNTLMKGSDSVARKRIVSLIHEDDPRSLLFEIQMIDNFLRNDFEVIPVDLAGTGLFDYLVSRDGLEAEVECKRITQDAGRSIVTNAFSRLADLVNQRIELLDIQVLLKFFPKKRLNLDKVSMEKIAQLFENMVRRQEFRSIEEEDFELRGEPLPEQWLEHIDIDKGAKKIAQQLELDETFHIAFAKEKATIIFMAECGEGYRMLSALRERMKDGVIQFSGTRPALLVCLIEGVEADELALFGEAGALQAMTWDFLRSPKREHIHTVGFISEQNYRREGALGRISNMMVFFPNANCKYPLPKTFWYLGKKLPQ